MAVGSLAQRGDVRLSSTQPPSHQLQSGPAVLALISLPRTDEIPLVAPSGSSHAGPQLPWPWSGEQSNFTTTVSPLQRTDPGCHL